MNHWTEGVQYAQDVVKGNIQVGRYVRLACQRFLNYLDDKAWQWEFRPEYVQHVLEFASYLKHTKGKDAGTQVSLQPFQVLFLCAIYGFRSKSNPARRMVQDVILFIPRKAGKSTLNAIVSLYELLFGEAGAEVFTLATNREQASIVFDASKGFIETMPGELAALYNVSKYQIGKTGDSQSMYKALSRDNKKTGDGKNASCAIIDEAAQIVDRNSIEVIHSGMVARMNPLRIYITTASFTKETKFFEDYSLLKSILEGDAGDSPRWFGLLYELDAGDDWRDSSTWAKANPMHGITVFEEAIAARAEEASHKPAALNEFLCKTLNVWVSANTAWMDRSFWDRSVSKLDEREPEAVFIGFDLAATRDLNAVCTLKRYAEDDYFAEWKFFLPEEGYKNIPKHYADIFDQARKTGILQLTEGNVMDDRQVSDYIKSEASKYPNVKEVGYDAYNAASVIARLYEAGIPVKKVGQSMAVLSNPSKHVEKLVMASKIRHNGNPFLGWQLGNCEVFVDVNGNIKVRKNEADPSAKVDGIIALIIAMHCSLDHPLISDSFGFRTF